jgi:hypothetical protein
LILAGKVVQHIAGKQKRTGIDPEVEEFEGVQRSAGGTGRGRHAHDRIRFANSGSGQQCHE